MSPTPILYQQTALSQSPSALSQILHINTGGVQQSNIFGAGRKRGFDEINGIDEEAYTRKHLATESSIFFRRAGRSPRSFLWRVLEEGKVLEIQCVDLVRSQKGSNKNESRLMFRLGFKDSIANGGVAFADSQAVDALECFVLTNAKEIYTFTFKRDLLTRDTVPSDFEPSSCFRKYSPSAFTHKYPYRFVAISSLELLITLHDGGFLRLERKLNEPGTQWRESFFSEQGWAPSLRGMMSLTSLKRNKSIRWGDIDLSHNALSAIAKSPDGKHIWTVSLDHQLRSWDTRTGKPQGSMDLMKGERSDDATKDTRKYVMSGEQGTLMQLLLPPKPPDPDKTVAKMDVEPPSHYYLVLHSPKEHEMKFFSVTMQTFEEGEGAVLEDLQPTSKLILPLGDLMQTNVWHLEEFFVNTGESWQQASIWIRARSGVLCHVFNLTFDLLDDKGRTTQLDHVWQHGWTAVDTGMKASDRLKECLGYPGELENAADGGTTPSEKWLDFLCYPGRFSASCLECALHVYRKARGLAAPSAKALNAAQLPLEERLVQAVGSNIKLQRLTTKQPDYNKYQADVHAEWKAIYSLISHLHKKRSESIALVFDAAEQLPWTVSTDMLSPIRACDQLEKCLINGQLPFEPRLSQIDAKILQQLFMSEEDVTTAQIMAVARDFRASLSPDFRERFANHAIKEAMNHDYDNRGSMTERTQKMYETLEFSGEVMDDEFQALTATAEAFDGLGNLTESSLLAVLEKMDVNEHLGGTYCGKELCRYGDQMTLEVVQEIVRNQHAVLLDLLNLIVFMAGDLDEADLHEDFVRHVGEIFEAICVRLKHAELYLWLGSKLVPEPDNQPMATYEDSLNLRQGQTTGTRISLLIRLFISGWVAVASGNESLALLLTAWSERWMKQIDLFRSWTGITAFILSFLIKEKLFTLAKDFLRFLPHGDESTSWLLYLQGRLGLLTVDYTQASLDFKAAAKDMAEIRGIATVDRANLLSAEQHNYFGAGQSRYFQHITSIFEEQKAFSHVAEFASISLECCEDDMDFSSSLAQLDERKANVDSPIANRIDDTMEEIRILKLRERMEELRNRRFNALVQTGRFHEAWAVLALLGETRKSNLGTWIKKAVEAEAVNTMLEVDMGEPGSTLAQEADNVLLGLAKKRLASGSGTPYHQILYAFRTHRSDHRGAAEILHEYLERLQTQPQLQNPEDDTLVEAYVLLINTLVCCGEEHAWLLAEPLEPSKTSKRKLVTLADVRRAYTAELDRRSDVLMGRFPLVGGGDEMDVL